MFVINRMTKNPMTVTADTKVDEVAKKIKKHNPYKTAKAG